MKTLPQSSASVLLACVFLCSSALAADPPAQPNVLLIVSDDLTAAALGPYGNTVCRTPHLDRLAAEGVTFQNAYCQYPVCGPSRASFMSGLYPNRTGMLKNSYVAGSFRANKKFNEHPSIGGFLRRHGYVSMRVSKIYHMGVPGGIEAGDPGGDDPDSWDRAFNVLAPETASPGKLELLSPLRKHYGSNFARVIVPDGLDATQADYLATTQAIAILESRAYGHPDSRFVRPDQPFFLAVGFVRPHVPLIAPRRIFDLYPEAKTKLPHVPEDDLDDLPKPAAGMYNVTRYGMNDLQQRQSVAAYYASVTFMDEQVGRLLDALDRLNLRDNTVVIFTSDHGYNLGEHHMWQKLSLFEDSARVPLIVSAPGYEAAAGQTTHALTELTDLYPTIADLTGLDDKAPEILDGHSLAPVLADPSASPPRRAAYTVSYSNGQSIRTDRYRYNRWGAGGVENEELYDHHVDPLEFNNQAKNPSYRVTLDQMRYLLDEKSAASQ
jgi:arylsulfatase A-like enzyme